jgi:hypothetical protein
MSSPAPLSSTPALDAPSPARKPRRWRRWLLLCLTVGAAIALFLWSRPEPVSAQFMEGSYASMTFSFPAFIPRIIAFHFHDGRFEESGFNSKSDRRGTYQIEGSKVRLTYSPDIGGGWYYRTFDGVALLLSEEALEIYERDGGLQPKHQRDPQLWKGIFVRGEPSHHRAAWARFLRQHPRFAAALPPADRKRYELSWRDYLRYSWFEFLDHHRKLRDRMPAALRQY